MLGNSRYYYKLKHCQLKILLKHYISIAKYFPKERITNGRCCQKQLLRRHCWMEFLQGIVPRKNCSMKYTPITPARGLKMFPFQSILVICYSHGGCSEDTNSHQRCNNGHYHVSRNLKPTGRTDTYFYCWLHVHWHCLNSNNLTFTTLQEKNSYQAGFF